MSNKLDSVKFIDNLKSFYEESPLLQFDFLSDFTLQSAIDGKEIKAHKVILASQSAYFKGFFRHNPTTSTIALNFEHSLIEACIQGIYTGVVPRFSERAGDILQVADYLGIEDLIHVSTEFIVGDINRSNCYGILKMGYDHGNDKLLSSAAAFIAGELLDDSGFGEEMYKLPHQIFVKILSSNSLVLRDKTSGVILTGLLRELHIFTFIAEYMSRNPSFDELEELLMCIRLSKESISSLVIREYKLVGEVIWFALMNISSRKCVDRDDVWKARHKQIEEMCKEMGPVAETLPIFYRDTVLKAFSGFSEELLTRLLHSWDGTYPQSQIVWFSPCSTKERRLNVCSVVHSPAVATGLQEDYETCSFKTGIIRKIVVHDRLWGTVPIVKGLEIYYDSADSVPVSYGLTDGPGASQHTLELEAGEYISHVEGRCGWMVDQLTFLTNKERKLGPVGGYGGGFFSTATTLQFNEQYSSSTVCGVQATSDKTRDSYGIRNLKFVSLVVSLHVGDGYEEDLESSISSSTSNVSLF